MRAATTAIVENWWIDICWFMDLSHPKAPTKGKEHGLDSDPKLIEHWFRADDLPDCRNCNRRRIKCDRGLPYCKKCKGRGLECTGYGVLLKWGQGVASRGHLTKLSVPKRPEKVVKNSSDSEASSRHKEEKGFKFQGQSWDVIPIEHPTSIWMKGGELSPSTNVSEVNIFRPQLYPTLISYQSNP